MRSRPYPPLAEASSLEGPLEGPPPKSAEQKPDFDGAKVEKLSKCEKYNSKKTQILFLLYLLFYYL